MAGRIQIPDAWDDDDWGSKADKSENDAPQASAVPIAVKSRTERLAQHQESNRQLWESAEAPPQINYAVTSTSTAPHVPIVQPFQPTLKVLSRKPAAKTVVRKDPITGLEQLTIQDDGDDEDGATPKEQLTAAQIREKQQRELDEKQRRYDEARAKLFGEDTASRTGRESPRGGRARGGRNGQRGEGSGTRDTQLRTADARRPASQPGTRELYDPGYSNKPARTNQTRGSDNENSRPSTPKTNLNQPIRAPRGPDGSGRGGYGFAQRGAKES